MNQKTLSLRIVGMTCAHCETILQKGLGKLPGVQRVVARFGSGTVTVTFDSDLVSRETIEATVGTLGYSVAGDADRVRSPWLRSAGLLALIAALFFVLQATGALNYLVPGQLAQAGMGYGMLFMIGLLTSVHCVAMCGGIALSLCVAPETPGSVGKGGALKPSLLYSLGRVLSYTVIGFIVGAVGSAVTFSPAAQGALKLVAGAFMVVMGVNLLGIFPWLRRLNPRMPRFLADRIDAEKWRSRSPFFVGLLNGLMPCGPLQAMQIYALSTGNPWAGALAMLLFSLGTVPLMLGLGALSTALSRRFTHRVVAAGAVLVAVLGLSMLSQGWALTGVRLPVAVAQRSAGATVAPSAASPTPAAASPAPVATGVQTVTSTLESNRYPDITVEAGTPVQWTITAPDGSINGCNGRMYIPEYQLEHTFTPGDNLITFTPTETGTFAYSCWMGMIRATITVVAPGSSPAAAEAAQATTPPATDSTVDEDAAPVPAGYVIPTDDVAVAQLAQDTDANPVQRVTLTLTDEGFSPAVAVVESGTEVEWTVRNSRTGAAALWVPDYAAQLTLNAGDNRFSLLPESDFAFSDDTGSFYGYIKVVDDINLVDLDRIRAEVAAYQTLRYPAAYFDGASGGSCCQ